MSYVHSATSKVLDSGSAVVGKTFLSVSSIMLFLIFTLIDTFFMLLYRGLIMKFLVSVFKKEDNQTVREIVQQVQLIIRKYIGGLLLEMALVGDHHLRCFFNLRHQVRRSAWPDHRPF